MEILLRQPAERLAPGGEQSERRSLLHPQLEQSCSHDGKLLVSAQRTTIRLNSNDAFDLPFVLGRALDAECALQSRCNARAQPLHLAPKLIDFFPACFLAVLHFTGI